MHSLYKRCLLSPLPSGEMVVRHPFVYKDVEIPKGFVFSLVPNKILPAQLVYEYLFSINNFTKAKEYLDEITEMLELGEIKKELRDDRCERVLEDALEKAYRICKRVKKLFKKEKAWQD